MNSKSTINEQRAEELVNRAHERVLGFGLGDIRISLLIRFASVMTLDRLSALLAPYDLSCSAYFAMIALFGGENLANPSELCAMTGETRGNMTRICDDLVKKGLLKRVENPADRRRVDLSLSEQAVELLHQILPALRESAEHVYNVFSAEEKAIFVSLLSRLNRRLESLS